MSQINGLTPNGPLQINPNDASPKEVTKTGNSRMSEVVQHAESGTPQPPRVHRSPAAIAGRVILGIVTLGISEVVRAIINKVASKNNSEQLSSTAGLPLVP